MTRNNRRKGMSGQGAKRRRRVRRSINKSVSTYDKLTTMRAYDMLIRDPCGAPFARPPYAGGNSGYFTRVTVNFSPAVIGLSGLTPGSDQTGLYYALAVQPIQFPNILIAGATAAIATNTYAQTLLTGTFLQNAAVKEYRPVSFCLKWVPTGPVVKRSGMVALGYSAGAVKDNGSNASIQNIGSLAATALERCTNGSSAHEIRFLPTPADEQYDIGSLVSSPYRNAATLFCVLANTDGVATNATTVALNGFFELTGVFEWLPEGSSSVSTAPQPPPPFTSQEYQSTISDIGDFLLRGVRSATELVGQGLARGATRYFTDTIRSIGSAHRYGASFPLIT